MHIATISITFLFMFIVIIIFILLVSHQSSRLDHHFQLAIKLNGTYNLHERLFQFGSKSIIMQSYALLDP